MNSIVKALPANALALVRRRTEPEDPTLPAILEFQWPSTAIVNANIKRIAAGRTMIIISHRLSSLVNSDAILVLERGSVADVGSHLELLERCEIYAGLWHQQNSHASAPSPIRLIPRSALRAV